MEPLEEGGTPGAVYQGGFWEDWGLVGQFWEDRVLVGQPQKHSCHRMRSVAPGLRCRSSGSAVTRIPARTATQAK